MCHNGSVKENGVNMHYFIFLTTWLLSTSLEMIFSLTHFISANTSVFYRWCHNIVCYHENNQEKFILLALIIIMNKFLHSYFYVNDFTSFIAHKFKCQYLYNTKSISEIMHTKQDILNFIHYCKKINTFHIHMNKQSLMFCIN